MAIRFPHLRDLRPYLPNRQTGETLRSGTVALVGHGWRWITAGGWRSALERLGAVALGAAVAAQLLRAYTGFVAGVVLLGWFGAASLLGAPSPPPPSAPTPADDIEDQEQDADDPAAGPDLAVVAALVRRVAGSQQGAHLDDLLATGELGTWDKSDLKAALKEWGVPVEEFKVRLGGRQRVRLGVRVRALPAALGEGSQHPAPAPSSGGAVSLAKPAAEGPGEQPSAPSPPRSTGPRPEAGVAG